MLGDLDSLRIHDCVSGDLNPIYNAYCLLQYAPFPSLSVHDHEQSFIVMGILWTIQSSHPDLSLYSKEPLAFGTAYYAISLGTNILLTVLIVTQGLCFLPLMPRVAVVPFAGMTAALSALRTDAILPVLCRIGHRW